MKMLFFYHFVLFCDNFHKLESNFPDFSDLWICLKIGQNESLIISQSGYGEQTLSTKEFVKVFEKYSFLFSVSKPALAISRSSLELRILLNFIAF